jgi:hypothetical protein
VRATHYRMSERRNVMACGLTGTTFKFVSGGPSAFRAVDADARCRNCERVLAGILGRAMLAPKGGAP